MTFVFSGGSSTIIYVIHTNISTYCLHSRSEMLKFNPEIVCSHTKAKVIKRLSCSEHFSCHSCFENNTVCFKCNGSKKRRNHDSPDDYRLPKRLQKDREPQSIMTELNPISIVMETTFDSTHAPPIAVLENNDNDRPIAKVSIDFMFDVIAASTSNFVSHVSLDDITEELLGEFL